MIGINTCELESVGKTILCASVLELMLTLLEQFKINGQLEFKCLWRSKAPSSALQEEIFPSQAKHCTSNPWPV